MVKYPEIEAEVIGGDGNAFAILGAVDRALREGGVDEAERKAYYDEATSGDYDTLLRVSMEWVTLT